MAYVENSVFSVAMFQFSAQVLFVSEKKKYQQLLMKGFIDILDSFNDIRKIFRKVFWLLFLLKTLTCSRKVLSGVELELSGF